MVDQTARKFEPYALSAALIRGVYRSTSSSQRFSPNGRALILENQAKLTSIAEDSGANLQIVKLREAHSRPLTYDKRHQTVVSAGTQNAAWRAEVQLVVNESQALTMSELGGIRKRAEKDLARAKHKLARHRRGREALHDLIGDAPIAELVSRLSTTDILESGSPNFDDLTKRQRQMRASLIKRDLCVLESTIMLLLNADDVSAHVFNLSFSLAVGSIVAV